MCTLPITEIRDSGLKNLELEIELINYSVDIFT